MAARNGGGKKLLGEEELQNKGCTLEGMTLVLELRDMLIDRFGDRNTFIAFARSLGKDGGNARAFSKSMSEKLLSRPRKTGPPWDVVLAVIDAVTEPESREAERRRLAVLWAAANGQWPNGMSPEQVVVGSGIGDGARDLAARAEQEVEFSRAASRLALELARAERVATSHARMAADMGRAFEQVTRLLDQREDECRQVRRERDAARKELAGLRERHAWLLATAVDAPDELAELVQEVAMLSPRDAADRRAAVYLRLCADAAGLDEARIAERLRARIGRPVDEETVTELLAQGKVDIRGLEMSVAVVVGASAGKLTAHGRRRNLQAMQRPWWRSPRRHALHRRRDLPRPAVSLRTRIGRLAVSRRVSAVAALALALAVLTGAALPTVRGGGHRRSSQALLVWVVPGSAGSGRPGGGHGSLPALDGAR